MTALERRGHTVRILEPADGWSRANLVADAGPAAVAAFAARFPTLRPLLYRSSPEALDALDAADPDLVVVHEWNAPALVNAIGARRRAGARFVLLFHDTHHRALTRPAEMARFDLSGYDGVLAFGASITDIHARRGWGDRAWTWHEAADARVFRPLDAEPLGDVAWVGNWGDDERSDEIRAFLLEPVAALGLDAVVHGVRYPDAARRELAARGLRYGGWIANHRVPELFARHRVTVHVPRRPYAQTLRGVPTIRVFEALACGIPLLSAPWADDEALFPPGAFLTVQDGDAMRRRLRDVLHDRDLAASLRKKGLACITARHTCDHRADELLAIHRKLAGATPALQEAV
jgi:spore maturation protein CgeB